MNSKETIRSLFALFIAVVFGGAVIVFVTQLAVGIRDNSTSGRVEPLRIEGEWVNVGAGFDQHQVFRWVDKTGLICHIYHQNISCANPLPSGL